MVLNGNKSQANGSINIDSYTEKNYVTFHPYYKNEINSNG